MITFLGMLLSPLPLPTFNGLQVVWMPVANPVDLVPKSTPRTLVDGGLMECFDGARGEDSGKGKNVDSQLQVKFQTSYV